MTADSILGTTASQRASAAALDAIKAAGFEALDESGFDLLVDLATHLVDAQEAVFDDELLIALFVEMGGSCGGVGGRSLIVSKENFYKFFRRVVATASLSGIQMAFSAINARRAAKPPAASHVAPIAGGGDGV
ncbi:MAG: hypothetical protein P4M05_10930 [Bradyrhizobium sp.]|nr:hypothetical protein [Bradyrhizobium sp.]